jgi:hypothetical protein
MGRSTKVFALITAAAIVLGVSPCALAASPHDGTWRVVLTWQDHSDLNLEVTGPISRDKNFLLGPSNTHVAGQATLDTNSLPGPGAETATIYSQIDGLYQFYVHDYSARSVSWYDQSLSSSGARLDVYSGGSLVRSFAVPTADGNLWTAFSLYRDVITPVGNMTFESDPRKVGTTLRSALIPGDILLGLIPESLVPGAWSHVAIYAGDGQVLEAASENQNVGTRNEIDWQDPAMTWVSYMRVNVSNATRLRAVAFARKQVEKQCPYDIRFYSKQANGGSWYCSELAWGAYYNATGGRMNLGRAPRWRGVYPWDIERDPRLSLIGGHYEKKPKRTIKVAFLYIKLLWDHMSAWIGDGWRWLWK